MSRPLLLRAFPLRENALLPLTGEDHPLRRETGKWLLRGNVTAVVLVVLLFVAWRNWPAAQLPPPSEHRIKIVRYADLGVPPSITRQVSPVAVSRVAIARAVAPPRLAIPEPVPDEQAPVVTLPPVEEAEPSLEPISLDDFGEGMGGGDSLVIGEGGGGGSPGGGGSLDGVVGGSPSPDDFVAVDQEPVRISINPPVYPAMARDAEIEGTVIVRALVGRDGKVRQTLIVDGNPMLNDAAVASAGSAVFRPALVDNQPVEVWVVIPVTFKLN